MPYTPTIRVGAATMAAHAEMRRMSSFWRTPTWVRFAASTLVRRSRSVSTRWITRSRWS